MVSIKVAGNDESVAGCGSEKLADIQGCVWWAVNVIYCKLEPREPKDDCLSVHSLSTVYRVGDRFIGEMVFDEDCTALTVPSHSWKEDGGVTWQAK